MKNTVVCIAILAVAFFVCMGCTSEERAQKAIPTADWSDRVRAIKEQDSLNYGKTYLSVYSQIYSYTEQTALDLTATVSIRNTSEENPIYLLKANYYDTGGHLIHSYTKDAIVVNPMETLEIVIAEIDKKGGTGANFIFEWATHPKVSNPIFEAVMISTYGQQGLSFMTHGERIQ